MMSVKLRQNNMYRGGRLYVFDNGQELLVRDMIDYKGAADDQYHTVRDIDTLDVLAHRYYHRDRKKAGLLWWIIADANEIHDPFDMESLVGTEIVIPNLSKIELNR